MDSRQGTENQTNERGELSLNFADGLLTVNRNRIWSLQEDTLRNLFLLTVLAALAFTPALLAESPAARWGHVFVYDEARDEILLFGGASVRGSYLGDTWTWKDGKWTRREVSGPANRGFTGAAYDRSRDAVVIHGGRGDDRATYSDTWSWDGKKWQQLQPDGDWKVDHHEIAWDDERQQLVGFGGWTGSEVSAETRVWTGRTWKSATNANPPPRSAFGMAFDPQRKAVVLYGGLWINGQYADTWLWNGAEWTALTGPYDDSSLDHHSIAWDGKRNELVLFGGKNYRYVMNGRTRSLEAKKWEERSREGPRARHSTPLTWHSKRGTVMLFGGKIYENDEQLPLGDLWEWDGEAWSVVE